MAGVCRRPTGPCSPTIAWAEGGCGGAAQKLPNAEHRWGAGPLQGAEEPVVAVFRHRLLQQFMLTIFSKLPVQPVTTMRDLR